MLNKSINSKAIYSVIHSGALPQKTQRKIVIAKLNSVRDLNFYPPFPVLSPVALEFIPNRKERRQSTRMTKRFKDKHSPHTVAFGSNPAQGILLSVLVHKISLTHRVALLRGVKGDDALPVIGVNLSSFYTKINATNNMFVSK
jgi:hypothetical protein